MEGFYQGRGALHMWKGACGLLSLVTFGTLLGTYFGDVAVGVSPLSTTSFRTGGGAGDELGWEDVELDTLDASWVPVTLFAVASGVSAIYYCALFLAPDASTGLTLQVDGNFNRHRWVRQGIVISLLWVVDSYVAGQTDAYSVSAVAVLGVLVALNQSAHESHHTEQGRVGESMQWLPRIEFWLGGLLAALFVFVWWYIYYGTGNAASVDGLSGFVPAAVFTTSLLYVLFHVVAVNGYVTFHEGAAAASKEYVYDIFEALQLHLTVWFVMAGLSTA